MSATLPLRPRLAPHVRLQLDPLTGGRVLLYPEGILELNETAGEIVTRCDGAATVEGIIHALAAEYAATPEELQADVLACVEDLQSRQLLVLAP